MKDFYRTQLILAIIGSALLFYMVSVQASVAFVAGVSLMSLNVFSIEWVWTRVISKKPVAWTVFGIVLKYTFLGIVMFEVAARQMLPVGWFSLGLATIIISVFGIRNSAL